MLEICIILLHLVDYCYEVRLLLVMEFVQLLIFLQMDYAELMMELYIVVQLLFPVGLRLVYLEL
jgi:hypothetical protein